MANGMEM